MQRDSYTYAVIVSLVIGCLVIGTVGYAAYTTQNAPAPQPCPVGDTGTYPNCVNPIPNPTNTTASGIPYPHGNYSYAADRLSIFGVYLKTSASVAIYVSDGSNSTDTILSVSVTDSSGQSCFTYYSQPVNASSWVAVSFVCRYGAALAFSQGESCVVGLTDRIGTKSTGVTIQ